MAAFFILTIIRIINIPARIPPGRGRSGGYSFTV